jgi:hypothetical protein
MANHQNIINTIFYIFYACVFDTNNTKQKTASRTYMLRYRYMYIMMGSSMVKTQSLKAADVSLEAPYHLKDHLIQKISLSGSKLTNNNTEKF